MSSLRSVTIIITAKPTSDTYLARSYPHSDKNKNGQIELYRVPVYEIHLKGKDEQGHSVVEVWTGLRFMPYWNDPKKPDRHYKTTGWLMAGLHQLSQRAVPLYKPDYGVQNTYSPFAGAIVMRGAFYVHAGPENLANYGWGSAGCVEVIGDFDDFKNGIALLAGSSSDAKSTLLQMVKHKKLRIQVDYAKPPKLKIEKEE